MTETLNKTPDLSKFLAELNRTYRASNESCALIETSCYELGKLVGLAKSGTNNKTIKASLERLANVRTTIQKSDAIQEEPPYWASQMLSCIDEADKLSITLNPILTKSLYQAPFTFINLKEQRQLSSEVAKRLHVWLSCWLGHGRQRRLELDKLVPHIWGDDATANTLRTRRNSLRKAIMEVAALDGWTCSESTTENSVLVSRPKL